MDSCWVFTLYCCWLCVLRVFVPFHPMTSTSIFLSNLSAFPPGPGAGPNESKLFLDDTEVTLHRHVQQTLGQLPSPASGLPEGMSAGQSEPNNMFYLITLLAILAGVL